MPRTDHTSQEILLVEDDPDTAYATALLLESEGFRVRMAGNGAEALRYLEESEANPCLIILDLTMPVMSGYELGMRLRHSPGFSTIPIIVVSAASNAGERSRAIGAIDFLQKPIDFDWLIEIARDCCPPSR